MIASVVYLDHADIAAVIPQKNGFLWLDKAREASSFKITFSRPRIITSIISDKALATCMQKILTS